MTVTYNEALEFIHSIERFGSKPGLRRVRALLERMGSPQQKLRFIHVAGTNGKGSICTMLSNILRCAGYKTGLYISPFVLDFRERIQLDNQMIPEEDLARITEYVRRFWLELDAAGDTPTEFEVVVAIAMEYFVRSGCHVVVLEVGMGGRFDATNVIGTPLASVIASIGIDHTRYLGDTLEQIAMEKCGIIKPGGVTVCYPAQAPEALAVIMEHCAERGNVLHIPGEGELLRADLCGNEIAWGGQRWQVPLAGRHQMLNALTVLQACRVLPGRGLALADENIRRGLLETRFPARMEVLCHRPLIVLDGGHNEAGVRTLAQSLDLLGERELVAACAMSADKDVDACLSMVLPKFRAAVATQSTSYTGAMPAGQLAGIVEKYCDSVLCEPDPIRALHTALAICGPQDALVLFGSLYFAADVRGAVQQWVAEQADAAD